MIRALATYSPLFWLRSRRLRSRFFNDERGVSAVEFALILPVMLVLYLGGVEVTKAITVNRKVTVAARTLADLVAQATKVTATDISNVLQAGVIVSGIDIDPNVLKLRVSSVEMDGAGVAKIKWSKARSPQTPRAFDQTVTLPPGLNIPNTSLIWSEVEYVYTPAVKNVTFFGYALGGSFTLQDKSYMRPRLSDKVVCDAC